MIGFYGFVPRNPGSKDEASLKVMLESMQVRMQPEAKNTLTQHVSESFSVGSVSRDSSGGVTENENTVLAVIGDIFEADRLYNELPEEHRQGPQPELPEILRRRFEHLGIDGLCGLNGIYAIAAYDKRARKLFLVTDRMGYHKLTYCSTSEGLFFGTRYTAYANRPEIKREFDPVTLYELVRYGFFISDSTFLKNISRVPLASYMEYVDGDLQAKKYWRLEFSQPDMSFEDCVDGLAQRMRTAVERRARGRIASQITGGLDSRVIAGFLREDHSDLDVISATVGTPRALDMLCGRRLARDLGYPHTPFYLDSHSHAKFAEMSVMRTEGAVINHTCWRLSLRDWIRENDRDMTTHGFMSIFARLMSDIHELIPNPGRETSLRVIKKQLKDMSKEIALDKLFRPEIYKEIADIPDRIIDSLYDDAEGDCDVHRYDRAELAFRQRNFQTPTFEHFYPDTALLAPLTDIDIVNFAAQMPIPFRQKSRAYLRAIVKYLPRTCAAPHSKDGIPLAPSKMRKLYYRAKGRMQYHVIPAMTGGMINPAPQSAYVPYRESLTGGSREFMLGCLDHADAFADIIDVNYLRSTVQEYADGKREGYGPAYTINTLLLWQKLFGE